MPRSRLVPLLLLASVACTGAAEDTAVPPLPADSGLSIDTAEELPFDTASLERVDPEPANHLFLYQRGVWHLGPAGGPWATLTGQLEVLEFVDWTLPDDDDTDTAVDTGDTAMDTGWPDTGDTAIDTGWPDTGDTAIDTALPWDTGEDSPLACRVIYDLEGSAVEEACTGCEATFDVVFTVRFGDPAGCGDPDLPRDGEIRRFGVASTEGLVYLDYGDLGVWMPWYLAHVLDDEVVVSWTTRLGVWQDEEDDR